MQSVGDFEYGQGALIGHGAFALVFGGTHKKVRPIPIVAEEGLFSRPGR